MRNVYIFLTYLGKKDSIIEPELSNSNIPDRITLQPLSGNDIFWF